MQKCDPHHEGDDIADQTVIDRIKETKVRIITVAFGWVGYKNLYKSFNMPSKSNIFAGKTQILGWKILLQSVVVKPTLSKMVSLRKEIRYLSIYSKLTFFL